MFIRFVICVLGLSALIQPAICLPVSTTTRSIHSAVSLQGSSDGQPDLFRREAPGDPEIQYVPLVERGSPSNGYYGPSDSYGDYYPPPKKAYSAPDADGPPKKEKEGVLNTLLGGPVKLLGLDGNGGGLLGNVLSSRH
ncbi:hypothetical protein PGT21_007520 [Puccinia graminis f. sp. tritici]|uniref:Uncharacterized protein n=1 Tax=Puccinia graminis f. sp. tritici TaxID=56615 RepID=A0A5B0RBM5_PUCGR|nr:hypothetical protein PGT21_007520 [Puccinia graminis f. sp. tritici]KAA1123087.1 hypothetical protein PGTUg99_004020 [Puccinia graminis f. sp. tritici]